MNFEKVWHGLTLYKLLMYNILLGKLIWLYQLSEDVQLHLLKQWKVVRFVKYRINEFTLFKNRRNSNHSHHKSLDDLEEATLAAIKFRQEVARGTLGHVYVGMLWDISRTVSQFKPFRHDDHDCKRSITTIDQ